jgi:hypothetical protein
MHHAIHTLSQMNFAITVRFVVFVVPAVKSTVSWNVPLCNLVKVQFCQTTGHHITEVSTPHSQSLILNDGKCR